MTAEVKRAGKEVLGPVGVLCRNLPGLIV